MGKLPQPDSAGEAEFALHCKAYCVHPNTEYPFHPTRKWRFDFCFPDRRLAIEIEGGTRKGGRHNRHDGFEKDAIKYNEAAILGWRVLRFTTAQVHSGLAIDTLLRALREEL